MATKKIVWHMPDGTVSVTTAAPKTRRRGESEEAWIERVARAVQDAGIVTGAVSATVIEETELPPRRLRESWRSAGDKPAVDLKEARKQLLGELRAERNDRLDASDKEKSRLDDVGTREQKQALATYRQSLRDLPATVKDSLDGIATVEGLLAWQPTWPTIAPTPSEVQK